MVVDTQRIYREAAAPDQLEDEPNSKRSAYLDALRGKETELRVAGRELAAQQSLLPAAEFSQGRGALEQKMFALQRELQGRKRTIGQRYANGMECFQAQLPEIDVPVEKN